MRGSIRKLWYEEMKATGWLRTRGLLQNVRQESPVHVLAEGQAQEIEQRWRNVHDRASLDRHSRLDTLSVEQHHPVRPPAGGSQIGESCL